MASREKDHLIQSSNVSKDLLLKLNWVFLNICLVRRNFFWRKWPQQNITFFHHNNVSVGLTMTVFIFLSKVTDVSLSPIIVQMK